MVEHTKPSFIGAVAPIVVTISLLFLQLVIFDDFTPHIPLVLGIAFASLLAWRRGANWQFIEEGLFKGIHLGMPSLLILMTVGMLIGVWILSGTVPTMIYYGLQLLSPKWFLLATAIICSVISLATGTSWGTIGTVGLALMGVGEGLGIPPGWIVGAIVSGSFFGDKLSPLSDTTNLAAASADVSLFDHIKHLTTTTIPSMGISLAVYTFVGLRYSGQSASSSQVDQISATLQNNYNISLWLLIPAILVMTLAVKRVPALPAIFFGVVAGGICAFIFQEQDIKRIFAVMQSGFVSNTGIEMVDKLLSKGGMQSMMWTISMMMAALGFGGVLEKTQCLETILQAILKWVSSTTGIVAATITTCIGVNVISGDVYLSILLPGRMYKNAYDKAGLSHLDLSRSLEDGGTMFSPLIPWNAGGAYVASTLGVATTVYAPYAMVCWLGPIVAITLVKLGLGMAHKGPNEYA